MQPSPVGQRNLIFALVGALVLCALVITRLTFDDDVQAVEVTGPEGPSPSAKLGDRPLQDLPTREVVTPSPGEETGTAPPAPSEEEQSTGEESPDSSGLTRAEHLAALTRAHEEFSRICLGNLKTDVRDRVPAAYALVTKSAAAIMREQGRAIYPEEGEDRLVLKTTAEEWHFVAANGKFELPRGEMPGFDRVSDSMQAIVFRSDSIPDLTADDLIECELLFEAAVSALSSHN